MMKKHQIANTMITVITNAYTPNNIVLFLSVNNTIELNRIEITFDTTNSLQIYEIEG